MSIHISSVPRITFTPPVDDSYPLPSPPTPINPALLDASSWIPCPTAAHSLSPSEPTPPTLTRLPADPRLAHQQAQAYAVARRAEIVLPAQTYAQEEAPVLRSWRARPWAAEGEDMNSTRMRHQVISSLFGRLLRPIFGAFLAILVCRREG
jgi:hypothetical protein